MTPAQADGVKAEGVDLDGLEAVARAATPGPWFINGKRRSGVDAYTIWGPDGVGGGTIGSCDDATLAYRADNARHIATFDPPTVLRLIAEHRELLAAASLARTGLETAIERFTEYAALHAAKGTPDGDEKAQRNADMAYSLRCCLPDCSALSKAKAVKP